MNISNEEKKVRPGVLIALSRLFLPLLPGKARSAERLPDPYCLPAHLQRDIGIADRETESDD